MTPAIRKLALTAHLTAGVGWVGALAVFLAHALASLISHDQEVVRAASLAMALTAWLVILPFSVATLITGAVQALGTAWGLVRHYWVLFKLLLTVVATAVLLLKLQPISHLAEAAKSPAFASDELLGLRTSLMIHAAGGMAVLIIALVLAVYKPQGLTTYGARMSGVQSVMPLWAKAAAFAIAGLFLVVVAMALFGGHGPGAHVRTPS